MEQHEELKKLRILATKAKFEKMTDNNQSKSDKKTNNNSINYRHPHNNNSYSNN
ncbi:hypothetical protein [Pectobacterium polonicum]|uniref:hypothetical protein n=1 Tax=Pectobacterium polonicum TaxID=2485124 RepID=UPI002B243559|nr:hypothetical protein [Pectobacterium polonicum]